MRPRKTGRPGPRSERRGHFGLPGFPSVTELAGRRLVHVAVTGHGMAELRSPTLTAAVAEGMEVIAVSEPGPAVARLHERGIRHVALRPVHPSTSAAGHLRAGRALVRLLGDLAPHIVHTHGPVPVALGPVAARTAGVAQVVHSAHGPLVDPDDGLGLRMASYGLERLTAACSRFVLVAHPDDRDVLTRLRVPAGRLVLVGDGVDLDRFRPRRSAADVARARSALGVDRSALVVGVVGRPTGGGRPGDGGGRLLCAVAARLHDLRPETVLVVMGTGDDTHGDLVEGHGRECRDVSARSGDMVLADPTSPTRSGRRAPGRRHRHPGRSPGGRRRGQRTAGSRRRPRRPGRRGRRGCR